MLSRTLLDYFRCSPEYAQFDLEGQISAGTGYFRFGDGIVCYGQSSAGHLTPSAAEEMYDALPDVRVQDGRPQLPFDPDSVVENLRCERYRTHQPGITATLATQPLIRKAYYLIRPFLPVTIRKHLQKINLRGWSKIPFPRWPVDVTADSLLRQLLGLSIKSKGVESVPFIWFWPDGAPSCAVMTHDVETTAGRNYTPTLMNINDSFGIKASFQIVPEKRYRVPPFYLECIRRRGFEVNVQDLNHDGNLYRERNEFLRRVALINRYGKEFGAIGFRAAVLYRNVDWYDSFDFEYDMSIPNVGHLDPQSGGCCTVMPYFVGKMVEIPVTTIQDYSLFQILGDYSIELWKQQIARIIQRNGLVSMIVHPDYILSLKAQKTYRDLLSHLSQLRDEGKLWIALPREVNRWWRERSQMKLVHDAGSWRIEGPGSERARIAYAKLTGDGVIYCLESPSRDVPV